MSFFYKYRKYEASLANCLPYFILSVKEDLGNKAFLIKSLLSSLIIHL